VTTDKPEASHRAHGLGMAVSFRDEAIKPIGTDGLNQRSDKTPMQADRWQPAAGAFEPDAAEFRRQARASAATGDRASAIRLYFAAQEIASDHAETLFELGTLLFGLGRVDDAVSALSRCAALVPDNPQVRHNNGLALARLGNAASARVELAQAVRLAPSDPAFRKSLALFDLSTGHASEAEAGFRHLIALDACDSVAHRNLARLARYTPDDPHLAEMEALLARHDLSLDARADLGFALFDALAKAGQHGRAFSHLGHANRLRRQKFPYDGEAEQLVFDQLRRVFSSDVFRDLPTANRWQAGPIFIIGMPRAGTTLIEQILSSHRDVAAGGESIAMTELLRRFLITPQAPGLSMSRDTFGATACEAMRDFYLSAMRDVAGRAPRFTDKMPLNFRWVGIIAAIMPEARFVHCRRDPVETCFSIHSSFFASGGNRYSHDLGDLADYYRQYRGLMAHWHDVLPGRIIDVELADVVGDQEYQTRRLLDFLQLDFDPLCLCFHDNGSQVATLSSLQVKKPVYGGHSERLKPYLPFLGPVLALRDEA
jgi:tetratricopeptide (TPR) repeat protein